MLLLAIFFFLVISSPVNADDFSGDNVGNQYFQTVSFNVRDFPDNCSETGCIEYDEGKVLGEDTSYFLDFQGVSDLTDFGNMRRIPMVADRLSAPPGTHIDILYYYLNSTGHHVSIPNIVIPFTKSNIDQGNLENLLSFPNGNPIEKRVTTIFNGNNLVRDGYMKEYAGTGLVLSGETGAYKIDEVIVKDPLNVDHFTVVENGDVLDIKVWIQNNSLEYLNGVGYKHNSFSYVFDLPPLEEIVLEYSLENIEQEESAFNLGSYRISNPNTRTECAIQGTNYYNWNVVNAVSVFACRDDGGWINGAYVQPSQESFCVTRIPYVVYSQEIVFEREERVEDEEILAELVVEDSPSGDVLGVHDGLKELPKTGNGVVGLVIFLVVDLYLWYAFLSIRRKYEYTNCDTGVCTKDSKDSR